MGLMLILEIVQNRTCNYMRYFVELSFTKKIKKKYRVFQTASSETKKYNLHRHLVKIAA